MCHRRWAAQISVHQPKICGAIQESSHGRAAV
jgi:hypothetical protein